MEQELWKQVTGFSGYSVSNYGRVRRDKPARGTVVGKILKNSPDANGYAVVNLSINGQTTKTYVHRLVAAAFQGPPPEGMHTAHWDGDGMNARLSNLRWATQAENEADKVRHGRANYAAKGSRTFTSEQVTAIKALAGRGASINSIAKMHGVSFDAISVAIKVGART